MPAVKFFLYANSCRKEERCVQNLQEWAAVQELYKRKISIRGIAKQLGMSRNTVRKLLKASELPQYHRTVYPSKLGPYKEQIYEWRGPPYEFNGTRIFNELKKRGYTGSIGPVYRYLKIVDEDTERISSKATVRIETPPGDQAQFDWSEYSMVIGNVERKVYCFSMILAASRKKAICFSLKSDAEAIYEAIQELFEDLGGVTLELLIDNPKALVISNNPKSGDEIRYNPEALLLARHLGTELNACPCYWPRKKGKIERPFQYIEEQFIRGNTFTSMDALNTEGKKFINKWCDQKHGTTNRIPNEHYLMEEKATLLQLPKNRFMMQALQSRIVSLDSLVSIGGSKYSVPVKYVGKSLKYRIIYGFRIEIYAKDGSLIQKMEACDHGIARKDEHYEPIAKKVSTSIPQIRRDFTERYSNGAKYLAAASRKFEQSTSHARKIIELEDLYDRDILNHFIGLAVDLDRMDIKSFRALLKERYKEMIKEKYASGTGIETKKDPSGLTRDLSYYDSIASGGGK